MTDKNNSTISIRQYLNFVPDMYQLKMIIADEIEKEAKFSPRVGNRKRLIKNVEPRTLESEIKNVATIITERIRS